MRTGTYYEVTTASLFSEQDAYEEGCDPNTAYTTSFPFAKSARTLPELVKMLGREFLWREPMRIDVELDACEEPGRIDFALMTTEDFLPADERDIEAWKRGDKVLRYTIYTVRVQRVTRETVDLSEDTTIDSYFTAGESPLPLSKGARV